MCGFLTAWDPNGLTAFDVDAALADIHHRGPDASAGVRFENDCLYMGHARLKIIDTSAHANQPFVSPCGRYTLIYNGEIYNFQDIRLKLEAHWTFKTHSDTEVLLAAWNTWGEQSLDHFVGMFAFAIFDAQEKQLTLVRDRFGIKPIYYHRTDNGWVFASEIQPLFRFMDKPKANESTIRTYLETGLYNHSKETFFADVLSLEQGCLANIDLTDGQMAIKRWYHLADHIPDLSNTRHEDVVSEVERLVEQAIHSHLIADVEVGLNVSGGVDSSMLVRVALEKLGNAHLFNQDYDGYSELPWVREIAEGGQLHVSNLGADDIEQWLEATVKSQAEPFGGVTVCGYNALYQSAVEQNVTVLLDGNGVDEIFLGYKKYHQIHAFADDNIEVKTKRIADYEQFWSEMPRQPKVGSSIDGTSGLRPDTLTEHLKQVDLLPVNKPAVQGITDPVKQAGAEDLLYAKIPRGLRFNDRVSMAHSRELRVPFLDHRLVEYAFAIPTELLLGERGTKMIFRDILAKRASESVAYAAKRSVQSPQREWIGKEWQPLIKSILSSQSFADRGWVNPDKAMSAYQHYLDGANDNSFFIWQWLNLELWARAFLD